MKRTITFSLLVLSVFAFAAGSVTPSEVMKTPDKFDKKVVKVHGIVKKFKARTSKAGADYLTFDLMSGGDRIAVYSHGKMDKALADGAKVEVEGLFTKVKTVGAMTFKNEIDVSGKKGGKPNVSILK